MGILKDFANKNSERKRKFQSAQDDDRIYGTIDERKKSHGERELIKVLEQERQEHIKEALVWEEKRRQAEERLRAREMMSFHPEFFNNQSILKENQNFLRGGFR
jgi:hypothetical protein